MTDTNAPSTQFETIGEGTAVFRSETVVEGPVRWLDSPAAVIEFVESGEATRTIAISRGGTTTFMAPALSSGVRGLLTLQGAPTSHLGILSREFNIPCIMAVAFTAGIETDRGEIVPADGTVVRLDISAQRGLVLAGHAESAGWQDRR